MRIFRLSPELAIDTVEGKGLIFLAVKEHFITVNRAAFHLLKLTRSAFRGSSFSDREFQNLLRANFRLTPAEGRLKARTILDQWLTEGIFVPVKAQHLKEDRSDEP
jgi:hypothetical protein